MNRSVLASSLLVMTFSLSIAVACSDDGDEGSGSTTGDGDGDGDGDGAGDGDGDGDGTGDGDGDGDGLPGGLCEGGWDTYILFHECDVDNCVIEYKAMNPDGSGITEVGPWSQTFILGDVNPQDGRVLLRKDDGQDGGGDVFVYDWFNDVETLVAGDVGVTEHAGEWSHQGDRLSIGRHIFDEDEGAIDLRCYWVLDDGDSYQPIPMDDIEPDDPSRCSWSPDAQEVIWRGAALWKSQVGWNETNLVLAAGELSLFGEPRWSSDDKVGTLARGNMATMPQLWTLNPDGSGVEEITDFEWGVSTFDWSPGGDRLAAVQQENKGTEENPSFLGARIVTMDQDGSNQTVILDQPDADPETWMVYAVTGWGGCP